MEKAIKPGIYTDLPEEDYHADFALGSSGAKKLIFGCPSRYEYDRRNPKPAEGAMAFGKMAHKVVLEGTAFLEGLAVKPADMTFARKAGKAWRAEMEEAGREIIKEEDADKLLRLAQKIEADPLAHSLLSEGMPELSIFWDCPRFGIPKKARIDLCRADGLLVDLKTCTSAHPDEVQRAIWNYGYFVQAAWYMSAYRQQWPDAPEPRFVFVFIESEPPHPITCVQLDPATQAWGEALGVKASEIYRRCSDAGIWPDYVDDIVQISLPVFGERKLQERHDAGAFEIAAEFQRPLELEETL